MATPPAITQVLCTAVALYGFTSGFEPASGVLDFELKTEIHRGSGECVEIVLISEGYSVSERWAFLAHCEDVLIEMEQEPVLAHYLDHLALTAVFVPVVDDNPEFEKLAGEPPTQMDVGFESSTSITFSIPDPWDVHKRLDSAGLVDEVDVAVVLVKSPKFAGNARRLPYFYLGPETWLVLVTATEPGAVIHELGHAIGQLGDEYSYSAAMHPDVGPRTFDELENAPNLILLEGEWSHESVVEKWRHFTELGEAGWWKWSHVVEQFRGWPIFSALPECRMRNPFAKFCPVCSEALAQSISEKCGLTWSDDKFHADLPLDLWVPEVVFGCGGRAVQIGTEEGLVTGRFPLLNKDGATRAEMVTWGLEHLGWDKSLIAPLQYRPIEEVWRYLAEDYSLRGVGFSLDYFE